MLERPRAAVRARLRRLLRRVYRGATATEPLVTAADVHSAYRLLLGRAADPDGWHTFSALVGTAPVSYLAGALLSSEEFRRTPMYAALSRREHDDLRSVALGDGLELLVSPHDLLYGGVREIGRYEAHLTRVLEAALRPGLAVCAVGANIGHHAVRMARRVGPAGRVYAFEARPQNAQMLAHSFARNGLDNAMVLALAVSDERTLLRYVAAQGTNGYVEPLDWRRFAERPDAAHDVLVQSICLDDLLALLPTIAILQLDVEGAEGRVLRGARRLLERDRPTVFSELALGQLSRTSGMSGEEYLGLLRPLGYEFAVLSFDGGVVPFGDDVAALCAHARAQPTAHVDVRCTPR
jgi:FkbM family methyltransferase